MLDVLSNLEIAVERTPDIIAGEINEIKRYTRDVVIRGAIDIGQRLCEAKQMVPTGSWGAWLRDNVEYSERTAQCMMRIYNEYGRNGIPAGMELVSMTNALQMIGIRDDVKQELIESGEAESLSSRKLQERIRELEAERDRQQMTIDSLTESQQRAEDEADRARAEVKDLEAELEDQTARMDAMKQEAISARASIAERTKLREEIHNLVAQNKRIESELERKKAEPISVVEVIPEAIAMELEELRSRARQETSESMILYRAAYTRMLEQVKELVSLAEEVQRFDGAAAAREIKTQLSRVFANLSQQMA